jgi:endogenous inhibitor of DNA gyrase (YacG/DUF329 family)
VAATQEQVYLMADVRCYHCGRTVGIARFHRKVAPTLPTFTAIGRATPMRLRRLTEVHCPRCGGPTFFDETETRREFPRARERSARPSRGVERKGARS